MTLYRNAGDEPLVFRDDSPDKHVVDPGDTFTIVGAQHADRIEALPGVERATVAELRNRADELGIKVPAKARKAEIDQAVTEPA